MPKRPGRGRKRRFAALALAGCLLLLGAPPAYPQDEQASNRRQLMFVPPPVEGVVSLGVYDSHGKLVRLLARAANVESFKAGLNGLVIDWDGNDDDGRPVPTGKYYARGVVVGDAVEVAGEAFYFNDFADNSGAARPAKLLDAALYGPDGAAVLVLADQPELILTDGKQAELQHRPLKEARGEHLKGIGRRLLVLHADALQLLDPQAPSPTWSQQADGLRDADSDGTRTVVLGTGGATLFTGSSPEKIDLRGANPARVALLHASIVFGADDGKLWQFDGKRLDPLDLGDPKPILALAAGQEETVWILSREGDRSLVRQFNLRARQVRDLELPPDLRNANGLSAARDSDTLLLFLRQETGERVVGLRFQNANARQSIWEKWFDRSREDFSSFDIKDGKVTTGNDQDRSPPVMVKPVNNPLQTTRQTLFQLTAVADPTGTWLVNSDGLPLCQVSKTRNVKQLKWGSDGQNGVRLYASDGRVVEAYRVTGLENLYRFEAGSFD
ncbi:MAG TPA: hypothetical protein VGD78_06495 [Chthoniobacterales bacterium]